MTTYEEITSRIPLLNDDELCNIFERCHNLYNDRQRIKRDILKKELTDKLQKVIDEILNNNFILYIDNLNPDEYDDCKRVCLTSNINYEIEIS